MLDILPLGNNWRYSSGKMDIKPSAIVKKCLFGEPDHDNLQTDIQQQLVKIQKADRLRWNYDFKHDEPLPNGPYKWEKVELVDENHNEDLEGSDKHDGNDGLDRESESEASFNSPSTRSSQQSSGSSTGSSQPSITEYFQTRKRSSPSTVLDETRTKRLRGSPRLREQFTEKTVVPRSLKHVFCPITKPDDFN